MNDQENLPIKDIEAKPNSSGPLQGLRILDFTRLLPGPLGTMLLADMGAEVIKVESPHYYDPTRNIPPFQGKESVSYLALNRSKKSLSIDYATSEGKAIILDMLKEIDIVIEQFRPGIMSKMGLGYDDMKKINPKIIYVAVTGYGQDGPYAQLAGHDLNYISQAGLLGGDPQASLPLAQIADVAGGSYMAVIACLSAVYARDKQGKGQMVDVAMLDGVMPLITTAKAMQWNNQQKLSPNKFLLSGALLNYNIYETRDQRHLALGTLEPKFWERFCEVIQKPDWKSRIYTQKPEQLSAYKKELADLFRSKDADDWESISLKHDLLINVVYELDEIDKNPQISARNMIIEQDHPTAGKIKSFGTPLKFSETKTKPSCSPPLLGQDSLDLMRKAGISEKTIQELVEKGILKTAN